MLIEKSDVVAEGTISGFTASRIGTADMGLAMEFFASIYSRPRDAVLRELAANGVDAQRDAGYDGPVEITLPDLDHPQISIADHGVGMDERTLTEVFGNYVASTKRDSATQIGGFGVGSKTPFAVADQFTVSSTTDGVTRLMLFAKLPDGGTGHKILSTKETGRPSGTTVSVPVGLEDLDEWAIAAQRVFRWWDEGAVLVDGEAPQTFHGAASELGSTETWHHVPEEGNDTAVVRISGVGYEVPSVMAHECGVRAAVIDAPLDSPLTISRSRETIDDTDAGRAWLKEAKKDWRAVIEDRAARLFDGVSTSVEAQRIFDDAPSVFHGHMPGDQGHYSNVRNVAQALDLPDHVRSTVITYYTAAESTRDVGDTLSVYGASQRLHGMFMAPDEFAPRIQRSVSRWAKSRDQEHPIALTVISPDAPGFDRFFPVDEVRWITGEELLAQTPKRQKPQAKPLHLERVTSVYSGSVYCSKALDVDQLREISDDGTPLVLASKAEIEDSEHGIGRLRFSRIALLLRGNRSIERVREALDRPVLTLEQAIAGQVDECLRRMTPKQRREAAASLAAGLRSHDQRSIGRLLDKGGPFRPGGEAAEATGQPRRSRPAGQRVPRARPPPRPRAEDPAGLLDDPPAHRSAQQHPLRTHRRVAHQRRRRRRHRGVAADREEGSSMTSIPYTSISTNGRSSLTVVLGDELTTITDDNPVFDDVLAELQGPSPDPDTVRDLLAQSTTGAVASRLEELTDRVSYDGTDVLFDGEPVHGTVVEHIRASLVARTRDWAPLAAFLERQAENPSMASRREMYDWIRAEGLTIAPDGRIVGYKGLDHDGRSVRSGGAYVDGAWVDGQVPNPLGAVVSMDRPQVDDDRSRTCSFGLHVGSYAYAQSWSRGIVATVLVDPADVVSIPSDSGGQKMRTCRYEVVRVEKDSATYLGRVGTVAPDEFVDLDDDEGFEDDDFDEDDEPRIHDFTV